MKFSISFILQIYFFIVIKVVGCEYNMEIASIFYQRNRCCPDHASMPSVALQQADGSTDHCRFCQKCGKFQSLSEFDGSKRSCRRQLLEHNERRKQARHSRPPEKTHEQATAGASAMYSASLGDIMKSKSPFVAPACISPPLAPPKPSSTTAIATGPPREDPPLFASQETLKSNWAKLFPKAPSCVKPPIINTPAAQPLGPAAAAAAAHAVSQSSLRQEEASTPKNETLLVLRAPTATPGEDILNFDAEFSLEDDPVVRLPNKEESFFFEDDETPPLPTGIDWSPPKGNQYQ